MVHAKGLKGLQLSGVINVFISKGESEEEIAEAAGEHPARCARCH